MWKDLKVKRLIDIWINVFWGVFSFKMGDRVYFYFFFLLINEMLRRIEGNKFFKDGRC